MVVIREGISGDLDQDIPQYKLWQILIMFSWLGKMARMS